MIYVGPWMADQKVVAKSGDYFATKENNGYALYINYTVDHENVTQFISDFWDLEDFDYEIDKAREDLACLMADALYESSEAK